MNNTKDVDDADIFEEENLAELFKASINNPNNIVVKSEPSDEQEESKPSNVFVSTALTSTDSSLTNLDFMSRMLHKDLRPLIKSYSNYLRNRFSSQMIDLFLDICDKLGKEEVSPDILAIVLSDLGVSEVQSKIIIKNYETIISDTTKVLCRSTYDRFREIICQEYFKKVNTGDAVQTLERIQNDGFFLPPFGTIDSDTFRQSNFGDINVNDIVKDLGQPLISHFKEINDIFPINGYIPSQVVMVSGPPGCFLGNTKVKLESGEIVTLEELSKRTKLERVITYSDWENELYWTDNYTECRNIGERCDFIKIIFKDVSDSITCTPEHKFLVESEDEKDWIEATFLREGDKVFTGDEPVVIDKVESVVFKEPIKYYDIVNCENHNYFIHVGDKDICVHNSGKTLFMMTEAVESLLQNKKVLYTAIGDLKPFDFVCRMCAMIMKTPMTKVALSIKSVYEAACRLYPQLKKNLTVQFMSPNVYGPNEWYKLISQLGLIEKNDVFFIDYDTNFASEKDSMYAKGDEVYTMAATLAEVPGKYVFIGSQPKIGSWKDHELGLDTASESSRKQQIVDLMLTISHDREVRNPKNHMGTINIPKNRRGGTTKFKYFLDPTGIIEPIDAQLYATIKEEETAASVVVSDDYDKTTMLFRKTGEEG